MLKDYFKKLFSIFVLLSSVALIFFINYYTVLDTRYNAISTEIDTKAVQNNIEQLDRLYERLDRLEVEMKKKNEPFETTSEFSEYNEVKKAISSLRNNIDRALNIKEDSFILKTVAFFSLKNALLIFFQIFLIIWIIYVFKGFRKTFQKNKKIDKVNQNIYSFDRRDEIEAYRAAYEAVKDHENSTASKATSGNSFTDEESIKEEETYKDGVEVEQEDFREMVKQQSVWQQSDSYEMEEKNEQELKDRLNSKKWEQKLKKVMGNPRVKLIVDYYRQGMELKDIAETTGLSRDEVDFVVKMWETVIKR